MLKFQHDLLAPALALLLSVTAPTALANIPDAGNTQLNVPASFVHAVQTEHTVRAQWGLLGDPALTDLIATALAANTDIRQAIARLHLVRAEHGISRSAVLPQGGISLSRSAGEPTEATYRAGLSLDWELDLFGRLAKQRDASRLRGEAAEAEVRAVQLAVASEVARTWIQLLGAREMRALRERSLNTQQALDELTSSMLDAGMAVPGDLARSRAETASDRAELQAAEDIVFALEARLAVLLAQVPGRWRAPASISRRGPTVAAIAIPDPAQLLASRPDVQSALRRLEASGAQAKSAAAARFPRLNLFGVLNFLSGDISSLFGSHEKTRSQGAALDWGVFSLPRLQAEYRMGLAATDLALAAYDQVVLKAIEDTEVALQRHASMVQQLQHRAEAASQSRISADTVLARYEEGAVSFFEALSTRRDALRAELAAVDSLTLQRISVVDVLRALGTAPGNMR